MKRLSLFLFVCLMLVCQNSRAQIRRLEPGKMQYLVNNKPNTILYHDTLYSGSKAYMQLFYRTRDQQLIDLYRKHQSKKISGQILGVIGSVATIIGIGRISSPDQKGLGWALAGGGFACLMTGGYLTVDAQKNLFYAVTLFNQRHNHTSLGLGVSPAQMGFVYKF